jgi:hypothetical protein
VIGPVDSGSAGVFGPQAVAIKTDKISVVTKIATTLYDFFIAS